MDPFYVRRCATHWDACYAREAKPFLAQLDNHGGVAHMGMIASADWWRCALHADIHVPQGIQESVLARCDSGITISLVRRAHRAKDALEASVAKLHYLLPLVALGEDLLAKKPAPRDLDVPVAGLTRREQEIAALVSLGYSNREIAAALGISAHTVRNQLVGIFRKASVSTRAELAGLRPLVEIS